MKSFASRVCLLLTGAILSAACALLLASRPEYCGHADLPRPPAAAADMPTPTLAPPRSVVVVQVEADGSELSELEVGWADN